MSEHKPHEDAQPSLLQNVAVAGITALGVLYLINPTAGLLELIPDFTPVIGNLDEATATAIVVSGLSYYGVNVNWLVGMFGQGKRKRGLDDGEGV